MSWNSFCIESPIRAKALGTAVHENRGNFLAKPYAAKPAAMPQLEMAVRSGHGQFCPELTNYCPESDNPLLFINFDRVLTLYGNLPG
jgi:hypothetical protein